MLDWLYFTILHLFAQVSGNPTREQTEEVTSLWQTGLWNSHIQADRFLLEDDRAIFMFKVKKTALSRSILFMLWLIPKIE